MRHPAAEGRGKGGPGAIPEISPLELKAKLDAGEDLFILDVREPHEYDICRLDGSTLIPLGELLKRVSELNSADDIVVHCKSGTRSAKAVAFLQKAGFGKITNLTGGILGWSDQVDPTVPKY